MKSNPVACLSILEVYHDFSNDFIDGEAAHKLMLAMELMVPNCPAVVIVARPKIEIETMLTKVCCCISTEFSHFS